MTGVKQVKYSKVKGRVPVGKPRKTWDDVLRKDLESIGIDRQVARTDAVW